MQTTSTHTAITLGAGEHLIRIRHASGGYFVLHPVTASVVEAVAGAAAGQAAASAAELGLELGQSAVPTLASVSPNPVTVGDTLTVSGTCATVIGLAGAAAGTSVAQSTGPDVLEPTATPLLTSVSPNPATIGQTLTVAGSADSTIALAGAAAGVAAAGPSTVARVSSLVGAAAGAGGASASGLAVEAGGGGSITAIGSGAVASRLTAGDLAPAFPTGPVAENDIIVVFVNSTGATMLDVSGYTLKAVDANKILNVYWKRAGASEAAPAITGCGNAGGIAWTQVYRGCPTAGDPFEAASAVAESATTSATASAIASSASSLLLLVGSYADGGYFDGEGFWSSNTAMNAPTGPATTQDQIAYTEPGDSDLCLGVWHGAGGGSGNAVVAYTTDGNNGTNTRAVLLALRAA